MRPIVLGEPNTAAQQPVLHHFVEVEPLRMAAQQWLVPLLADLDEHGELADEGRLSVATPLVHPHRLAPYNPTCGWSMPTLVRWAHVALRYSRLVQVHLCGVRGSSPTPGTDFEQVGGHTSCVAIAADGGPPSLVLDAGTGLRNLTTLLAGAAFDGTIVLGHLHWDHVMGLPFFAAGDRHDARVHLMMPEQGVDAVDLIARLMGPPLFPITPAELRGQWEFSSYGQGTFEVGPFTVMARDIPHRGGRTMGLRVSDGHSSLAYLSDHSPHDIGPGADGLGDLHPAAEELVRGVDLLIHDAQYTTAELPSRATWGHAAAQYCVTLAKHCGVRRVLLFHHDPGRTDQQVFAMRDQLCADNDLLVEVAAEGDVIQL